MIRSVGSGRGPSLSDERRRGLDGDGVLAGAMAWAPSTAAAPGASPPATLSLRGCGAVRATCPSCPRIRSAECTRQRSGTGSESEAQPGPAPARSPVVRFRTPAGFTLLFRFDRPVLAFDIGPRVRAGGVVSCGV